MTPTTNPTKKTRALPRVWARFFSLNASETFTYEGKRFYKSIVPFVAIHRRSASVYAAQEGEGDWVLFAPWTRVQTDVLVRKSNIQGKQITKEEAYAGLGDPATWAADKVALDAKFKAKPGSEDWESCGGTTQEQNESREFVKQPNSDNGVSGPTS